MNVKTKAKLNFKKNIISVLVAAAMALSFGAVTHVSGYMHQHSRTINNSMTKEAKNQNLLPMK